MRNLGIFIIFLVWLLLGWWMCTCYCAACCEKDVDAAKASTAVPPPVEEIKTIQCHDAPICFVSDECEPRYGSSFAAMRDSLIALVGNNQNLRISGVFAASEKYEGNLDNLGLCRAEAVKAEFAKVFDGDRIETLGQRTVGSGRVSDIGTTDLIDFSVVDVGAVEVPGSTLIYFPFNSSSKLDDSNVEEYLDQVAQRVKSSGERIRLTGHTDDIGSNASNMKLGQRRADVIKAYLVSKGVAANKIITNSKGESTPIATNDTERGRAKNRRTELEIIK